jgi:hypothetical protein
VQLDATFPQLRKRHYEILKRVDVDVVDRAGEHDAAFARSFPHDHVGIYARIIVWFARVPNDDRIDPILVPD